jgi:6-phosphogluconolactonase (cycloisomerase 2 family)
MIYRLKGCLWRFAKIVLPFGFALALAGCGSGGSVVCNASSGSGCSSPPGPEVLYGFASTTTLNLSVTATIDASTGGFGTVSSGPTPFFANSAAVASNNQYLYISNSFIDGQPNNGPQIFGFSISPTDGSLTSLAESPFFTLPPPTSTQGLTMTPNGQFLYGADFNGFIYGFSVDSTTGALTSIANSPFTAGPIPQLVVDPSGKFLYASDENDPNDAVLAFTIDASGSLTPVPGSPFPIPGPGGGTSEPFGIVDTGSFVYTALLNQVAAFSIDSATGALTSLPGSPFPAGNGAFVFALVDNFLYVVNQSDGTVSAYRINSSNGSLTPVPDSPFGSDGATLATDSSGKYLYLGTFKGIQGYNIDSATGALSPGSATFGEDGALWMTTLQLPSSNTQ